MEVLVARLTVSRADDAGFCASSQEVAPPDEPGASAAAAALPSSRVDGLFAAVTVGRVGGLFRLLPGVGRAGVDEPVDSRGVALADFLAVALAPVAPGRLTAAAPATGFLTSSLAGGCTASPSGTGFRATSGVSAVAGAPAAPSVAALFPWSDMILRGRVSRAGA